jgi:hypothetical protein
MYNLRKIKGTYKGLIGECMFKHTRKKAILPKYFNKEKYKKIFGKYLSSDQLNFIIKNWYSLDCIEITFESGFKKVYLYEIKTKNQYNKRLSYKLKVTESTVRIYENAKKLGFNVKLGIVKFFDDWNFKIEIKEFAKENYCIDKPKKYDLPRSSFVPIFHNEK